MPTSFLLKDFSDIEDTHFTELGVVTVICGKNDSGKTRLLTALAAKNQKDKKALEHITPTVAFEERFLDGVLDELQQWDLETYTSEERQIISEYLSSILSQQEIWRRDEIPEIVNRVKQDADNKDADNKEVKWKRYLHRDIELALSNAMPPTLTPDDMALVPPKRNLLSREDSRNAAVKMDGRGIVAKLFNAKNRNVSHPDRKRFEEFCGAFTLITGGYKVDVEIDGSNAKLSISDDGENWRLADEVGLGFRDLVVILYFAIHSKYSLMLIEEPENHLHPEMQRRLLEFLSAREDKQFIITTHSSVFLDNRFANKMYLTQKVDGQIQVSDITSKALALNELGYDVADNVVSDLIILCEGPSDVPVIKEFLRKKGLTEKYSIKLWPLGGDIMGKKEVDLEVFLQSYKVIALVDRDPDSNSSREKFVKKCEDLRISVTRLERYAIENYFTLEALRKEYGDQIPPNVTEIDPNRKLEDQVKFSCKKKNFNIARAMSLEDVEGTDFGEFLGRVEQLLQQEQLEEKVDAQSN